MASDTDDVRVVLRVDHRISDPEKNCLAVLGSSHELGCWKPEKAVRAEYMGRSTWQAVVKLHPNQTVMWKWVVIDVKRAEVVQWESGIDKAMEIHDKPLMGVSKWGEDISVNDISSESSRRLFQGIHDIGDDETSRQHTLPRRKRSIERRKRSVERRKRSAEQRNRSAERKGRVAGVKVTRVNSKTKVTEDHTSTVRSLKQLKSTEVKKRIPFVKNKQALTGASNLFPNESSESTENSLMPTDDIVKVKHSKGLKNFILKKLRNHSKKTQLERKLLGKAIETFNDKYIDEAQFAQPNCENESLLETACSSVSSNRNEPEKALTRQNDVIPVESESENTLSTKTSFVSDNIGACKTAENPRHSESNVTGVLAEYIGTDFQDREQHSMRISGENKISFGNNTATQNLLITDKRRESGINNDTDHPHVLHSDPMETHTAVKADSKLDTAIEHVKKLDTDYQYKDLGCLEEFESCIETTFETTSKMDMKEVTNNRSIDSSTSLSQNIADALEDVNMTPLIEMNLKEYDLLVSVSDSHLASEKTKDRMPKAKSLHSLSEVSQRSKVTDINPTQNNENDYVNPSCIRIASEGDSDTKSNKGDCIENTVCFEIGDSVTPRHSIICGTQMQDENTINIKQADDQTLAQSDVSTLDLYKHTWTVIPKITVTNSTTAVGENLSPNSDFDRENIIDCHTDAKITMSNSQMEMKIDPTIKHNQMLDYEENLAAGGIDYGTACKVESTRDEKILSFKSALSDEEDKPLENYKSDDTKAENYIRRSALNLSGVKKDELNNAAIFIILDGTKSDDGCHLKPHENDQTLEEYAVTEAITKIERAHKTGSGPQTTTDTKESQCNDLTKQNSSPTPCMTKSSTFNENEFSCYPSVAQDYISFVQKQRLMESNSKSQIPKCSVKPKIEYFTLAYSASQTVENDIFPSGKTREKGKNKRSESLDADVNAPSKNTTVKGRINNDFIDGESFNDRDQNEETACKVEPSEETGKWSVGELATDHENSAVKTCDVDSHHALHNKDIHGKSMQQKFESEDTSDVSGASHKGKEEETQKVSSHMRNNFSYRQYDDGNAISEHSPLNKSPELNASAIDDSATLTASVDVDSFREECIKDNGDEVNSPQLPGNKKPDIANIMDKAEDLVELTQNNDNTITDVKRNEAFTNDELVVLNAKIYINDSELNKHGSSKQPNDKYTHGNKHSQEIEEYMRTLHRSTPSYTRSVVSMYEKANICIDKSSSLPQTSIDQRRYLETSRLLTPVDPDKKGNLESNKGINYTIFKHVSSQTDRLKRVHDNQKLETEDLSAFKNSLLYLVDKYKVPIGVSLAAACATVFICKKNL